MKSDVRERFERLERRIDALAEGMLEVQKDEKLRIATSLYATPLEKWEAEWDWFLLSHRNHVGSVEVAQWMSCHPKPSVQSPPPRFKAGDWVRHKVVSNIIGRVVVFIVSRNEYSILTNHGVYEDYHEDRLELWVPRDGEWVMYKFPAIGETPVRLSLPFRYEDKHRYSPTWCYIIPAPLGPYSEDWFK